MVSTLHLICDYNKTVVPKHALQQNKKIANFPPILGDKLLFLQQTNFGKDFKDRMV
jgi:hypothetical protein